MLCRFFKFCRIVCGNFKFLLRFRQRLETITSIKNVVENVTLLCELLWAAMQLDLERLKNRVDNSEEVIQQVQDCVKRIVRTITNESTQIIKIFFSPTASDEEHGQK